jgi:hypothetical protein
MGAIIEGDKRRCPRQMRRVAGFGFLVSGTARIFYPQMDADFLGDRDFQIAIGIAIGIEIEIARRKSRVASQLLLRPHSGRNLESKSIALLFHAKVGGRVSPRAAFRCAEGWEGRASLVRGQADACPSLRLASPMARAGGRHRGGAQRRKTSWPLCEIELGCGLRPHYLLPLTHYLLLDSDRRSQGCRRA